MKISELIGTVSQVLQEHGDIEVRVAIDSGDGTVITSTALALNVKEPGREERVSYVCFEGTAPDPA